MIWKEKSIYHTKEENQCEAEEAECEAEETTQEEEGYEKEVSTQ